METALHTLTPDERALLRQRHMQLHKGFCRKCGDETPCPTIRCLDALEAAEAQIERLLGMLPTPANSGPDQP